MNVHSKKNIWLVEDDHTFAESIIYILNHISGLHCKKHFASFEALQDYLNSPSYSIAPDLILMDIRLPGLSGIEAVKLLGKLMPGIPVVMMTMNDDKKYIVEAMKAGAVGYVIKGDPYDRLVEVIRNAIDGWMLMSDTVKTKLLGHLKKEKPGASYELTERQTEVLALMCDGLSKGEIATRLAISNATADNHFRHIYQRLGVNSAHAAVALALRQGLVS